MHARQLFKMTRAPDPASAMSTLNLSAMLYVGASEQRFSGKHEVSNIANQGC